MRDMEKVTKQIVNATSRYQQVSVETADQLSLVTLLYDGLIRFMNGAVEKMKRGAPAHDECRRARDIAYHLLCTLLDDGSELAMNLKSIYFYLYRQIIMADLEQSASKIEEILPVVQEVRSGWMELKAREGGRDRG